MISFAPYIKWTETQEEALLSRTKRWAAVNTFSANLQGLALLSKSLAEEFSILGGESALLDLPSPQRLQPDGALREIPLGKALAIRKRPHAPVRILLGGHYDTVFSPADPFQKAEETSQATLKGPGVADMKGGLSILLTALEAVERSPAAERLGWEILITPDEEIGSPGSQPLYRRAAADKQAALLFEPSFPDGAFASERQGSANYTVQAWGKAAHVGRAFSEGKSAVFALAHFLYLLEGLQKEWGVAVNAADIEGKGPVNIVPSFASCKVNLRSPEAAALDEAAHRMKQLAAATGREGIRIEIVEESFRPPKPFDDRTRSLFEAYGSCARTLNIPFSSRPTGGVCDGNVLGNAGLPTLDTAGAVGGSLHTADEYLVISSLVERSKLAALFLLKLAAGEIRLGENEAL
jgi:glutamate carboxypeptidase